MPNKIYEISIIVVITSILLPLFYIKGVSPIDKTLLETAIILNVNNAKQNLQRRLSSKYAKLSSEDNVTTDFNEINYTDNDNLTNSIIQILSKYDNENKLDVFDFTVDYLSQNKDNFLLTNDEYLDFIKTFASSLLTTGSFEDKKNNLEGLHYRIMGNIVPQRINTWNNAGSALDWSNSITKLLVEMSFEFFTDTNGFTNLQKVELEKVLVKSTMNSVLELINDSKEDSTGFKSGIVDPTSDDFRLTMMYGGKDIGFEKFDPRKSEIILQTSKSLAEAFLENSPTNINVVSSFKSTTDMLGSMAVEGVYNFMKNLDGDHSLFAYELSKTLANGLSLGSVLAATKHKNYQELSLPSITAENIANSVAFSSIEYILNNGLDYDISKVAQSVSFGSAQGAQLASVYEKSLNYTNSWEKFSRKDIAKKSSSGSANGAVNSAAKNYISPDNYINDNLPIGKTNWNQILAIAQASSIGSSTANTAMSVYFPTEKQSIINYSSQGSSYGSITANNLTSIVPEPDNPTSEIKIDVARASATGSAIGTTFEIVGLLNTNPKSEISDPETISAVEAATYGSTFGAIQAGTESLNSDAVLLKQAAKQGSTIGSLSGIGLALGEDLKGSSEVTLESKTSILKTITTANATAATNASRSIATKSIKTSANDMLLLMRKFNISPKYTNPTRIFQNTKIKNENVDISTEENSIELASPI